MKRNGVGSGAIPGTKRREWVERFRASGLGLKAFAAANGLRPGQLHYWTYDRRPAPTAESGRGMFREIHLGSHPVAPRSPSNAEIGLPDGTRIRVVEGADVAWVGRLIEALHRPCSR